MIATVELEKSKIVFRENEVDGRNLDKFTEGAYLEEDEIKHVLLADLNQDPATYSEAMSSADSKYWVEAMKEELQSMNKKKMMFGKLLIDQQKM